MPLSVGILGFPNSGKSTLFNALLSRRLAETATYPFTTIKENVGVVEVPDPRLEKLGEILKPEKLIPATIRFVDVAGLVKGAHKGKGLGNQFLAKLKECAVLLHVIRAFENQVEWVGPRDPEEAKEVINLELMMKDLETIQSVKASKSQSVKVQAIQKVRRTLEEGKLGAEAGLSEEEKEEVRDLFLLTMKPMLYVLNVFEDKLEALRQAQGRGDEQTIIVSAKLEEGLSELEPSEQEEYLSALGISSALDRIIKAAFDLLGLLTFFTIKGGKIVQAWPIKEDSTILEAAGVVHSDFREKFIKAERMPFSEFQKIGSWKEAKEQGKVEVVSGEGKVRDGDIVEFRI